MSETMTQHEKILAIMLSAPEKWWHSEDLMSNGEVFVGYKAQARISELALRYPEMIETQPSAKGNRQHMYRFRTENSLVFLKLLMPKMRKFVEERMKQSNLPVQKKRMVPRFNPDNTVTMIEEVYTL